MRDAPLTTDHLWVRLHYWTATEGIVGLAGDAPSAVAQAGLPQPGCRMIVGEACPAIGTVMAARCAHTPVSRRISEVNATSPYSPALVRGAPRMNAGFIAWRRTIPLPSTA